MSRFKQQGSAKTVLVLHQGQSSKAVITDVVATARPAQDFSFDVDPRVAPKDAEHHRTLVAPFAEELADALGLDAISLSIEFVPLEAFGLLGIESQVEGRSADLSVIVAAISALTGIQTRDDVLLTGALSSAAGHIGAVQHLTEKVGHYEEDERFSLFICPALDRDRSVQTLLPQHLIHERTARKTQKPIIPIAHIEELWKHVFINDSAVRWRYSLNTQNIPAWLQALTKHTEEQFWTVFSSLLRDGFVQPARNLLELRLEHTHSQNEDIDTLNSELLAALGNMPLAVKRLVPLDSLLPLPAFTNLQKHAASPLEIADLDAAFTGETNNAPLSANDCLSVLLNQLDEQNLVSTIDAPIDAAMASFVSNWERSASSGAFWHEIQRFLAHISNLRTGRYSPVSAFAEEAVSVIDAIGQAHALIENAQRFGASAMRPLLESICEQQKKTARASYTRFLIVRFTESTSYDVKVELAARLIEHFHTVLPEEVRSEKPERYAKKIDQLLIAIIGEQAVFNRQILAR